MIVNDQELHKAIQDELGIVIHDEITVTFDELKKIYQRLLKVEEYFPVTFIHRDDLQHRGFDLTNVDNITMTQIAGIMEDYYMDNGFWNDLYSACEKLEIPKIK